MRVMDDEFVSLGLIDNAFDFIENGLESIISESENSYKYAVLHLFSGTLLFFKDILYQEHWRLIFQNVDDADRNKLNNGEIKSVNFDTLLTRLKNSEEVKLTERLINDLRWMQKERNNIEHFHNMINPNEVKSRIANLLNSLILFMKEHKESDEDYSIEVIPEYAYEYGALFEMIQDYSFKFEKFVEKRNNIIKKTLEEKSIVIYCPTCNQNAVELNPDMKIATCHFCLKENTLEMFYHMNTQLAFGDYYFDNIEDRYNCPNCTGSSILYECREDAICFECFARFNSSNLVNCPKCTITIETSGGRTDLCDSCMEHIMMQ